MTCGFDKCKCEGWLEPIEQRAFNKLDKFLLIRLSFILNGSLEGTHVQYVLQRYRNLMRTECYEFFERERDTEDFFHHGY